MKKTPKQIGIEERKKFLAATYRGLGKFAMTTTGHKPLDEAVRKQCGEWSGKNLSVLEMDMMRGKV